MLADIAPRGLAFDVPDAWPRHLAAVAELAVTLPELTVVVDHLAKPPRGTNEMAAWASGLATVAAAPNTVAKLSGLQAPTQPLTAAALRPVFDLALELFGPRRLMYGGDWPLTVPYGGYRAAWSVYDDLIRHAHAGGAGVAVAAYRQPHLPTARGLRKPSRRPTRRRRWWCVLGSG